LGSETVGSVTFCSDAGRAILGRAGMVSPSEDVGGA
jgi:hypothetical protein